MSCIREALSSRGKVILDIAAMLLFAVIPFWRMGLSGLWEINDRGFPWVPQIQFGHSLSTWLSPFGGGPGFFNIIEVQRVWENAIWFAANLIGVATPIIQRCYLIGATFVAMVGMYYLVGTFFPFLPQGQKRIAGIVSALFYVYNPWIAYWIFIGGYPMLDLVFLPAMVALLSKGLLAGRATRVRYSILTALVSVPVLSYDEKTMVTTVIMTAMIAFALIAVGMRAETPIRIRDAVGFLALVVLLSFLLNAWWILPLGYYLTIPTNPFFLAGNSLFQFVQAPIALVQSMRLQVQPFVPTYTIWPWWQWAISPFVVFTGLSLYCLSVVPVLFRSPRRFLILSLLVIQLVFTGLSVGPFPPFGQLYSILFSHSIIFRTSAFPPYFLLGASLFVESILLGIAITRIASATSTIRASRLKVPSGIAGGYRSVVTIAVVMILVNSYPFVTGNFSGTLAPVSLPTYYYDAASWINSQPGGFNVLWVPDYTGSFSWTPNVGNYLMSAPPTSTLFEKGVIYYYQGFYGLTYGKALLQHLYASIEAGNLTRGLAFYLNLLDVKYVMLVGDEVTQPYEGYNRVDTSGWASDLASSGLVPSRSFGNISFFANEGYSNSLIYGSANYLIVSGSQPFPGDTTLPKGATSSPLNLVLLNSSELPIIQGEPGLHCMNCLGNSSQSTGNDLVASPQVSFQQLSVTDYRVSVVSNGPFVLVFDNSYDDGWTASIDGSYSVLRHIEVNTFANGWIIRGPGAYSIDVRFAPQVLMTTGLMFTLGTLAVCTASFFWGYIRASRRKRFSPS